MLKKFKLFVTAQAFQKIDAFLSKRGQPKVLRIGVRGAGCCGLKYFIESADRMSETNDITFCLDNEVFVIIDKKSIYYVHGSLIHWVENDKESGLKLDNPQQKTTCRCGKSFSV